LTTRSGFVALAGRPNVGKSTLANAIVGAKVAIVSDKPQTTRRAIRGIASGAGWQLVLVDLPGVQRPRDALTERMQRRVERELQDADGCLFVVNAEQGIGPGDRFIAELLRSAPVPVMTAVNKLDRVDRAGAAAALQAAADLEVADEILPVSAHTGEGVPALRDALVSLLPEGPFYFEPEALSDQSERFRLAELVREQVLARTREEVPHAVEVQIESIAPDPEQPDDSRPARTGEAGRRPGGRRERLRIDGVILVETESQKGILIGAGGRMIKSIGTAARRAIERELAIQVHLALRVRVRKHWRADEQLLDRLGIE
jgi:GTP-binding protein Era